MSYSNKIDLNSLYVILLRETENDLIQDISPDLYLSISDFIGRLKTEDYDSIEKKVKDKLISMITNITSLLLKIRLEKATKSKNKEFSNLVDEEKFILDSHEEMKEKKEMILSGTLNGKSKLLETIAHNYKIKPIIVRFLKETEQILGADLEKYGPYKVEDIANIPLENAQALISKKIATKIFWED